LTQVPGGRQLYNSPQTNLGNTDDASMRLPGNKAVIAPPNSSLLVIDEVMIEDVEHRH
jgi:hypothetical protein